MADDPVATPIEVAKSAAQQRIRGQIRLALAGFAGALVGKHILPAGLVDDTMLDAGSGLVMMGAAVVWQDVRARLQHSRLWQLAINPRVPADLVRPVSTAAPETVPDPPPAIPQFTQGEDQMTLKTFIVQAEETAIAALKSAGVILEHFVVTETQKLVAQAKTLPVGTLAMNIISALESHTATGEEKMAALIGAVTPALHAVNAAGGLSGLATSVEDFAKEFAQSAFNDFRAAAAPLVLGVEQKLAA